MTPIERFHQQLRKYDIADVASEAGLLPSVTDEYLDKFITQDEVCLDIKKRIKHLVGYNHPVLIQGETGTGKELLANALHGSRVGKFIPVNLTSLPDELVASELFGHIKGSFTGAYIDKQGLFEEAKDGTLFLDEIGDMPLSAQAKILRALQEKKGRRVGSNVEYDIKTRIVCATHRDIERMVKDGEFRQDLYYRISTFIVDIPSLRERGWDEINLIAKALGYKESIEAAINNDPNTSMNILPGNVRELQSIITRQQVYKTYETNLQPHST